MSSFIHFKMSAHIILNNFVLMIVIVIFNTQIAVTIQPCPTNKIAPHRRLGSWSSVKPRTFGSVLELFHEDNLSPTYGGSELQESQQEDDPDDCGDIEDYDETEVSSEIQTQRLQGYHDQRFFLGHFFNKHPFPTKPYHPQPQTRPPTGGYFGTNHYRPPQFDDPSDALKPVHEEGHEQQATYRPGVVGGPSGHVVGIHVKPHKYHSNTQSSQQNSPTEDKHKYRPVIGRPVKPNRYTQAPSQNSPTNDPLKYRPHYTTRRPREYSGSIVGSFFDLLF